MSDPEEPVDEPPGGRSKRHRPPGVSFETWIDRQIREAMDRGAFDDLPGAGKPLRNLGDRGDSWIMGKLQREGIEAPLPGKLALRREVHRIQDTLADVDDEARAREIIEDLNAQVRQSYRVPEQGPAIWVSLVPVDEALAEWRRRRSA